MNFGGYPQKVTSLPTELEMLKLNLQALEEAQELRLKEKRRIDKKDLVTPLRTKSSTGLFLPNL